MSDVHFVCQTAFVSSLKEIQSQFYLLPFIAKGQYAFVSPLSLPRSDHGAFPPTGGDTDHDFSNSIKGKLHLSRSMFCTV